MAFVIRVRASLLLLVLWGAPGAAQSPPLWRDAPEYLPLFAPPQPHRERYRTFVSPDALDAVLARLADDATLLRTSGAWQPRATNALDAFGQAGGYNRWDLARLYGARTPRVARGTRVTADRQHESWTLVSPYPSPSLRELAPGTLLLVLKLP